MLLMSRDKTQEIPNSFPIIYYGDAFSMDCVAVSLGGGLGSRALSLGGYRNSASVLAGPHAASAVLHPAAESPHPRHPAHRRACRKKVNDWLYRGSRGVVLALYWDYGK